MFLADNVLELLRPIAPGQNGIDFCTPAESWEDCRRGAHQGFFTACSRLPLCHGRLSIHKCCQDQSSNRWIWKKAPAAGAKRGFSTAQGTVAYGCTFRPDQV